MKPIRLLKWIIVILFIPLMLSQCNPPEHERIDVMTFNIRYDNRADGMFAWDERKDMVFWTIKAYKPDVVGIQEALNGQVSELDSALSDYNRVGLGREDGKEKGEYVPLFYRKDRFAKIEEGHFWLSETPDVPGSMGWDAACTRMVSWVKLREVNTSYEFYFFNTHFDHVGEEAKKQSALLLIEKIRNIARLQPLVITGDFNSNEESEPYKIITRLFSDARNKADKKVESMPTTYLGFPADITKTNIIDHIFVSPHFGVKEYEIAADNSGGYFPSDHLPVWVSLELRMP